MNTFYGKYAHLLNKILMYHKLLRVLTQLDYVALYEVTDKNLERIILYYIILTNVVSLISFFLIS